VILSVSVILYYNINIIIFKLMQWHFFTQDVGSVFVL